MANDFPGPFSPDQLALAQGYYGVPDVNMSAAPVVGAPDAGASYYGPPAPPPPAPTEVAPAPVAPPAEGPDWLSRLGTAALGNAIPAFGVTSSTRELAQHAAPAPAATPAAKAPPAPGGITAVVNDGGAAPKDDREFAAFRHLQDTKKKPAGGGAANPDPFGVKGAQAKYLGTFDEERNAINAGATAEGDRSAAVSGMRADLARQQQEDAAIHAHEQEIAQQTFDTHMAEASRQLDEVRAQKIDPGRLMKGDGMAPLALVGGVIGGLYMGLNKLDHNPFIDELNKLQDRDIAVQEKNIDNDHRAAGERLNMLREQRATFKDNELAKLQSKQLMYEATKQQIDAEAAKYDQPIVQARAQQAISAIDRAQAQTDLAIREAAQRAAAAAGAASAAQVRAQQLEMRKAFGDTYEKNIAAGMAPAQAEAEAGRMVQNLFSAEGAGPRPASTGGAAADPVSAVPKDQRAAAIKEMEEHSKVESGVKNVERLFDQWSTTGVTSPRQLESAKSGVLAAYKSGLGPGMSSDNDSETFIKPNAPQLGDSPETLALKRKNIVESMRSKVATPTLDRHAAGWKGPAPVKQTTTSGKPKS